MIWRRRGFLVASLGVPLTACAHLALPNPADGARAVEVREDSPRFVTFIGAKAQHAARFLDMPETNFYCLRSFVDRRTGEAAHQLYVTDSYFGAERGWNAARDSAGAQLPFIAISHDEITCDAGCSYVEEFAAKLPDGTLRANTDELAVTFSSRSGDEKTIVVPGARITAQLAAVDAKRKLAQPAGGSAEPVAAERSAAH